MTSDNVNPNFSKIWSSIHIIASCYDPLDKDTIDAARCYYYSLSKLLPNFYLRSLMQEFISENDITPYLKSSKDLLSWTFSMRIYIYNRINNLSTPDATSKTTSIFQYRGATPSSIGKIPLSQNITGEGFDSSIPFSVVLEKYDRKNLTKSFWGPYIWYLLHVTFINMPIEIPENLVISIKSMLTCLTFLLPCQLCKEHLRKNLGKDYLDINPYIYNRYSLFTWSVKIHNILNKFLQKPQLEVEEAAKLYT